MTILARLLIALLSLCACCSCATKRPPAISGFVSVAPPDPQPPDLSGVLSLMGRSSLAHACPISETLALTNRHVVIEEGSGGAEIVPFMWESMGQVGLLGEGTIADRFRDLAYVHPYKSKFPRFYPVAKVAPQPGDRIWFLGYDFRKKDDVLSPRVFDAKVIRVRVGHIAFYRSGVAGSSGSCVLNAAGEVVGINKGGIGTEDRPEFSGIAVGTWPPLLEMGT